MFGFLRTRALAAAIVGLLVPFAAQAAGVPGTVETLRAAHADLVTAQPDRAVAELNTLTQRYDSSPAPEHKNLLRGVRYVMLNLSSGDAQGAKSRLETLIQEAESSERGQEEPKASITSRGGHGGHGRGYHGGHIGGGHYGSHWGGYRVGRYYRPHNNWNGWPYWWGVVTYPTVLSVK